MTVNLRIKLAKASGLIQALRILQDEPGASGSLQIKDGSTVATLAFAKGRLTGAALSPSGERGEAALAKLAGLKVSRCNYSKRQKTFLTETPLDIAFEKFIEYLTSLDDSGDEVFLNESSVGHSDLETINEPLTSQDDAPVPVRASLHEADNEKSPDQSSVVESYAQAVLRADSDKPITEEAPEPDSISQPAQPAQPAPESLHHATCEPQHKLVNAKSSSAKDGAGRSTVSEIILALGAFRHFPAAEFLGICCLGILAVGIFIVPAKIKSSVGGLAAERQARENLSKSINADLLADESQESAELAPRRAPTKAITEGLRSSETDVLNEDLRSGRLLVSRNKPEPAIPYYKSYLRLYPDNVKVRTELIDAYIATNDNHGARLLCIQTLKKNLNSEQMSTIWRHLQRCQTN